MSTTLEAQLAWQCNSVFVAEWIQRALLNQPVELDERQQAFVALYRKTEHAQALRASLVAKLAKGKHGDSCRSQGQRTLNEMRAEDAGRATPIPSMEPAETPMERPLDMLYRHFDGEAGIT